MCILHFVSGASMVSSTELFVMIIYMIGLPLLVGVVRSANLPGSKFFLTAYFFLMLSNIFTVIEDRWFGVWCNVLEHACITVGAILFSLAIRTLIVSRTAEDHPSISRGEQ